ncbi:MAG TPA: hypothetical protein VH684_06095 [Xanthobacteraceae bacterium]|jgi:hypothetical protein
MVHAHAQQLARIGLFLGPLMVVVTPPILLGLLGIFVTWLSVVAFLLAAVVALDIARRSMRLFARQSIRASRRATTEHHRR